MKAFGLYLYDKAWGRKWYIGCFLGGFALGVWKF